MRIRIPIKLRDGDETRLKYAITCIVANAIMKLTERKKGQAGYITISIGILL